jgi:PHS family inorganic phosphate transporter-like MFS transporter
MDPLPEPELALPAAPRTYGGNAAFHNFYNDYSHITDPNLRRRLALSEVDKIPFGWCGCFIYESIINIQF